MQDLYKRKRPTRGFHETVIGMKKLLLDGLSTNLLEQFENERHFTSEVVKGYGVEDAFPEFLARKGR